MRLGFTGWEELCCGSPLSKVASVSLPAPDSRPGRFGGVGHSVVRCGDAQQGGHSLSASRRERSLAQMVERPAETGEAAGSSPAGSTRDPGAYGVLPCRPFGGVLASMVQWLGLRSPKPAAQVRVLVGVLGSAVCGRGLCGVTNQLIPVTLLTKTRARQISPKPDGFCVMRADAWGSAILWPVVFPRLGRRRVLPRLA